jgi:hypothetical protein
MGTASHAEALQCHEARIQRASSSGINPLTTTPQEALMTDDSTATPAAEPDPVAGPGAPEQTADAAEQPAGDAASAGPSASEAWAEVVTRMSELSAAVGAWAKAAADNPENRRHLDDVRNGVNSIAKEAADALDSVTRSDFGQQVKSGAEDAGTAIGDAAAKVSDAAAPHVATAFAGLADFFGKAAHSVGEAAQRQKEAAASGGATEVDSDEPPASEPAPPPAPPIPDE